MSVQQEQLIAMNQEIWAAMLDLALTSTEVSDLPAHGPACIGACVQLVGAWEGAVRLDCTRALAKRAAERLQGKSAEELSLEEVRDTLGELANMAAGSVKALLPTPTHLSLPSVADGNDYDFTIRRGRILLQCPFECSGESLLVSLIERDPSAPLHPHGCQPGQ